MGRDDFNPSEFEQKDAPSYKAACMGLMVCPHCGRSVICGDLEFLTDGKEFHQPTKGELEAMDISKHRNKDKGNGASKSFAPFLNVENIPEKGGLKAKVMEFREAPPGMPYSDFLLDIKTSQGEFTVGLKSESVLLDMLIDKLGPKTEKYKGKAVTFVRGGSGKQKGKYINLE